MHPSGNAKGGKDYLDELAESGWPADVFDENCPGSRLPVKLCGYTNC